MRILKFFTYYCISFILLFLLFELKTTHAYNPLDVPSTVKRDWDLRYGSKDVDMRTGKKLVYDIYYNKYVKGGYEIVNKDFGNAGDPQPYLHFTGWSIIFGREHHTSTNHQTYIIATKGSSQKHFRTQPINISATEDLEYNNEGPGKIWNRCSDNATNKSNVPSEDNGCNMEYNNVGFHAWIPLGELFPDNTVSSEWNLFIVKVVDGYMVYSPLILPFEFSNRSYNYGTISLSSGQNANNLVMVSSVVMRRTEPRQIINTTNYFEKNRTYVRVDQDETMTAVWYGVRSPHDNNRTRWASSGYWLFGGEQATLSFTPEKVPPIHQSHSMTSQYRNGNDYWVKPNTDVTITLRQYDSGVGNKYQYLRLLGSGNDFRARHDFTNASNTNVAQVSTYPLSNNDLSINGANRTENTSGYRYGTVQWSVTPKQHAQSYDVLYYYQDRAGNAVGYNDTGMNLKVDGVAPTFNSNSITGAKYIDGNNYWVKPNDTVTVKIRQYDPHSGNKYQYLRLSENGSRITQNMHDFNGTVTSNVKQHTSSHVVVDTANRIEDTAFGTVEWKVTPKEHGHNYLLQRYFTDNVGNTRGYEDISNLLVDGVSPTIIFSPHSQSWTEDSITVKINISDEDSGVKRFRYRVYENGTWGTYSSWINNSSTQLTLNNIGQNQIEVEAEDNVGNLSRVRSGYYYINNLPTANFDWQPKPAYQSDNISLTNLSTEPDGQDMTAVWDIVDPEGNVSQQTTWDAKIDRALPGNYVVKLTVEDEYGGKDSITKSIYVYSLDVIGHVDHTPDWDRFHQRLGNLSHQFYSGETFVISAETTPGRTVNRVTVSIEGVLEDNSSFSDNLLLNKLTEINWNNNYKNENLIDPKKRLKNGPAYFVFKAYYDNGHVATDIVEIEIIGGVYEVIQINRMY